MKGRYELAAFSIFNHEMTRSGRPCFFVLCDFVDRSPSLRSLLICENISQPKTTRGQYGTSHNELV
jgi:hypothetical protein